MTRLQNSIINIVREWTGIQDLSLLPEDHPAKFFVNKSLSDFEDKDYVDLLKMLDIIKGVYVKEISGIVPEAGKETADLEHLKDKVPYLQRFRYNFLKSQIIEITRIKEKIHKKYKSEISEHNGYVTMKYLVYLCILGILITVVYFQVSQKSVVGRDSERKQNLEDVLVAVGKYYLNLRDEKKLDRPYFPDITEREESWAALEKLVSPYIEDFPEEMIEGTDVSYYNYVSNLPGIGPPGTCFVLDLMLETEEDELSFDDFFLRANCDSDNNDDCFFRAGVYTGRDDNRYYRLSGGGC